jgi:hypothetical protein
MHNANLDCNLNDNDEIEDGLLDDVEKTTFGR